MTRVMDFSQCSPSHANVKLSNMALLHLFSIYHCPLCKNIEGQFSAACEKNWTKDSLNSLLRHTL